LGRDRLRPALPLRALIESPEVRVSPHEELALTGAGRSLVGFCGLSEVQTRQVAPLLVRRSRQAVSAALRYFRPCRGSKTVAFDRASLSLARPFRAHRRIDAGPTAGCALPGFGPLQRIRKSGFGHRGPSKPATFRPQRFARSRRLAPRNSCPGLFHPGNAHGVVAYRAFILAGKPCPSRGLVLSCRS